MSHLCKPASFLAAVAALTLIPSLTSLADIPANTAVNGVGLGLDGTGIKIGMAQIFNISGGKPVVNNRVMPHSGPPGGQNGEITLFTNQYNNSGTPTSDDHSSDCAGVIMGLNGIGVAPNSQLFSIPVTTINDILEGSQDLLRDDTGGPDVAIMNYSLYSSEGPNDGQSGFTQWMDWAAQTNPASVISNKLFVVAGNETPAGLREVPWDDFNGITVGATAGASYSMLANYAVSDVTADGRYKTDIVAPGGGTDNTGSTVTLRNPVLTNASEDNYGNINPGDGLNDNPQYAGTSFSAPMVSGAASLLLQDAANHGLNLDHRVLKAIILNGASTNVGTNSPGDWHAVGNIGTKPIPGGGGATTPVFIGWDANLGTGLLDVAQSKINLDAGQQNPGSVSPIGWDLNSLTTTGTTQDFQFSNATQGLSTIAATLAWDRPLTLNDTNGNGVWDPNESFTTLALNDLDLKLFDVSRGDSLVYYSTSALDSIQHIDYSVPSAMQGDVFDVQVDMFDNNNGLSSTGYGLAWDATAVPEPASLTVLGAASCLLLRRRRIA